MISIYICMYRGHTHFIYITFTCKTIAADTYRPANFPAQSTVCIYSVGLLACLLRCIQSKVDESGQLRDWCDESEIVGLFSVDCFEHSRNVLYKSRRRVGLHKMT